VEHFSALPIMIVMTDNHYISRFFKDNFKERFFVMDFSSLMTALETIKMLHTSVIILDQKFECPSIWEVCQKINHAKRDKLAPLFLISNLLKKDFVSQAYHVGVSDFIAIPLSVEEVQQKIEFHAEQQIIKSKMKKLKSKLPKLSEKIPFTHEASYDEPELMPGFLLCVKSDPTKPPLKKYIESFLRPLDKIIFEEKGMIGVFLGKTSNRAAQYIAETILSDAPHSTVIGIMPILASKEEFDEGVRKAKEILPSHEKNLIITL